MPSRSTANSAATAFGAEPYVHVHEARSFLGVMLAGPGVARMPPPAPAKKPPPPMPALASADDKSVSVAFKLDAIAPPKFRCKCFNIVPLFPK